jgi:hypothetical protein
MVTAPAIGLMVAAGLGIAGSLIGMLFTLASWGATPELPHGFDPDAARIIQAIAYGSIGISLRVIGIAVGIFILFGAIRMQKMTGHGLAMAAAIIAMIPCLSPCCLLGVPFGIWALVVLSKPEVKSQFH